jgi:protein-S-isoprenylcysteine O-methyltransferase Ste14
MKSLVIAEGPETRATAPAALMGPAATVVADTTAAEAHAPRDRADGLARIFIVALFSFMAVRIGANFLETGRLTGLLLLASEGLVVVLTVFRRAPLAVDRSLRARVLTTLAMMGPPLVAPGVSSPLVADTLSALFGGLGLSVVVVGKISLGRSFGLIPANRGIVSTGLYRLVRHPIYLGYLITHVAFLAANPGPWNLLVLVVSDGALLVRAICEEETLSKDPEYVAYKTRVRWRVVPGMF